jgi:pyruvate-formate lyase-activating enzyme
MRRKKLAMSHSEVVSRYAGPLFRGALRYVTPKKASNLLRCELDMRRRRLRAEGLPYVLHLEPTNACTLRCPLCITGAHDLQVPTGMLKFNRFAEILGAVRDHVVFARLDGVGEPFLNADFIPMLEYTHALGIGTVVSSNFQSCEPADMDRVVRSGLDYLIVSLDGVSQQVYEQYRVGGDIEKVKENLHALLAARARRGSRTPFVEWQFLEFDHNAHEVDEARRLAAQWGVDRLLVTNARPGRWQDGIAKSGQKTCYWFYKALNVAWTGDLKACCSDGLGERFSIGNLLQEPLPAIWNGPVMTELRDLFVSAETASARIAGSKCITHCPLTHAARRNVGLAPLPGAPAG